MDKTLSSERKLPKYICYDLSLLLAQNKYVASTDFESSNQFYHRMTKNS